MTDKSKAAQEIRTGSGEFAVKEVYTPSDVADLDYAREVGLPGQYPFTRGIYPSGHRGKEWPLEFYSGFGSREGINERYKRLVNAGASCISLALDLPTQLGYDSDHPMAEGEVGKAGAALDTLDDLDAILDGIPLDKIALSTVGNCISPWILAMFYALGEKRGMDPEKMAVWRYRPAWVQNDPIKEYTGRGTYIFPIKVAMDLSSDVVEYAYKSLPGYHCQYNCTTTIRWGGGGATQEIGFGIASLIAYIEAAREKGVSPEDFVPTINLHMTTDNDFFEEVAKFRAARRLWAKITRERFDTEDPRVLALKITVFTGAHRLTAQQPLNNVIRTTVHVLASMAGGVEHIHVPAYDEALALPTFESTWLAHITKHILHDECGVDNTVDPIGGSYYVENLTNQMEQEALKWFRKVEDIGGAVAAIESGYYLRQMADGMYKYTREVEEGKRKIIGINAHNLDKAAPIKLFKGDPEGETRQLESLKRVKKQRDNMGVEQALTELRKVAEQKEEGKRTNIVPAVLQSVRANATVGEIFGVLREVFGEYVPINIV